MRTASLKVRDYDFVKPQVKPEGTQAKADARPLFYFEYPGGFTKTTDATRRATARMRMLRRDADVVHGTSGAIGLRVGVPFMVDGVGEGNLAGKFIVTELTTRGHQTFEDDIGNRVCQNSFAAIPDGMVWAPPLLARKPRIRGVQTVVVTGPGTASSESIHVDNYGRIKVHFFWDRVGQLDENASCWLRVTQAQMGGTMILPRVGWELSVAFLEGDPDRPFAIGRLYNAENTPPDALPGAKASGSIKSMSSPGGAGQNEMKMSDSGGSQGHGMSAQKDLNVTIGNNKTETIAVNEDHSVTVNMSSSIKGNETVIVASNQAVDIGAVLSQNIGGNETIVVGGADTTNADSNLVEKVTGNRDYSIGGMSFTMQNGIEHTVQGNLERDVSAVQLTASVGSISDNIVGGLTQKAGAVKVILAKGSVVETITGSKNQIAAAAEVHLIKGGYQAGCDASVTRLIGGVHQLERLRRHQHQGQDGHHRRRDGNAHGGRQHPQARRRPDSAPGEQGLGRGCVDRQAGRHHEDRAGLAMAVRFGLRSSIVVGGVTYRVREFALREEISELSALRCTIVNDAGDAPEPATLLDAAAVLTIAPLDEGPKRTFVGKVVRAERTDALVEIDVLPTAWRMSRRADCRIFQQMSVVDIVKKVLTDAGVTTTEWKTTGSYATRDYTVQYRETDLEFVARLLSEEGIYFAIHHDDSKDTMVFGDDPKGFGPVDGPAALSFRELRSHGRMPTTRECPK